MGAGRFHVAECLVSRLSGFSGFLDPFSHRFPYTSFRASAVGYGVTSLRDFRQNGISPMSGLWVLR
jgi:hypothetical protein